jgi:hypothetical protein
MNQTNKSQSRQNNNKNNIVNTTSDEKIIVTTLASECIPQNSSLVTSTPIPDLCDTSYANSNISCSSSDSLNQSTRIVNPDGTRTLIRGIFKVVEDGENLKTRRNKYFDFEIDHEKNILSYGARIRRSTDPSSKNECRDEAKLRRIRNPVKIVSKRLCSLVRNVPKEEFRNRVELFNYTLVTAMRFQSVEGESYSLTDGKAKEYITMTEEIITKYKKRLEKEAAEIKKREESAKKKLEGELAQLCRDNNSEKIVIPDSNSTSPVESSSEEMEKQIEEFNLKAQRVKEMREALEAEIKVFESLKLGQRFEFLIKKYLEKHSNNRDSSSVRSIINRDYNDESFPSTLEKYRENIQYFVHRKSNTSGTRQEYKVVAYTYDPETDTLYLGSCIYSKRPSNIDKNQNGRTLTQGSSNKVTFNEEKGKKIATARLIRTPVIANNFSKNSPKGLKMKVVNEHDDKCSQYDDIIRSTFHNTLLHYVHDEQFESGLKKKNGKKEHKEFGCSNRQSNSKKDLRTLDNVIRTNPKLKDILDFSSFINEGTANKSKKSTSSMRRGNSNTSFTNSVSSNISLDDISERNLFETHEETKREDVVSSLNFNAY